MCFEMEVESCKRDYGEGLEDKARSDELSNTLLATYCALRDVPSDLFGDGSLRARYAVMSALMVAMDATSEGAQASPEPEKPTA